eukprot:m.8543 g.8543  ORF g.8543 m.8543 type:complete len:128 (+) comp5245_c0_seq1:18-401(+)
MEAVMPAGGALATQHVSAVINGEPTDVVCTRYSNTVFVLLTQIQKIGVLLHVLPDAKEQDEDQTYTVKFLLGFSEDLMIDVCAREIGKRIMSESQQAVPVLLGLSLKTYDAPTIRAAIDLVMAARVW